MSKDNSNTPPRAYTVNQVAEAVQLSPLTVYRRIASGDIQAVRFGRSLRVPASVLDSLLSPQ